MIKEKKNNRWITGIRIVLLGIFLAIFFSTVTVHAEGKGTSNNLQNGSFEKGQTWTNAYFQPDQSAVPAWNTTAFQGKIELFRENIGTYIPSVKLKPTDGTYAAELNADEESTLYQNVTTSPASIYKWGLDHGARTQADTMALIIGPKQENNPSKPSKDGRDQLMQMVDWLIAKGKTSIKSEAGLGEQLVVYSKKFGTAGTFIDNEGNNAFSLTPSSIYTEEWHIWIIADKKSTSGENIWGHYGSNTESNSGGINSSIDLTKYYLYTVPTGQTETLFGFVSVGCYNSTAKTYGNFLDNINFELYHPLVASTTTHGSAVVRSDGSVGGVGSGSGYEVTINNKLTTYVTDGQTLTLQAVVRKADADAGCEFVGLYYTKQDGANATTVFLQTSGNVIDDTGSLTEEEKQGKWIKSVNTDGDVIYTYSLNNVTSSTALHTIFIKSPTVTYDPNGGDDYVVKRTYNTDEYKNVYSFKPATGGEGGTSFIFIAPYVSTSANPPKNPENPDNYVEGWKFMGWKLTGDVVSGVTPPNGSSLVNDDQLGSLILPAEHTIACDYDVQSASSEVAAQYFKILSGNVAMTENKIQNAEGNTVGVTWIPGSGQTIEYANMHKGITMVAQWRWLQTFIPQVETTGSTGVYQNSDAGGTVAITSVTDPSDPNYSASVDAMNKPGAKFYYAETGERVIVTATENSGYTFAGWYDGSGKLISTNKEYSYSETKEKVTTLYARFSSNVTQTYIRQVNNGSGWKNLSNDVEANNNIGTIDHYSYVDKAGSPISATATEGNDYKFVGWYDSSGNQVESSLLTNGTKTISYTTTGDATYYARFVPAYKVYFKAQTENSNGDFENNTTGGTVNPATGKFHDGYANVYKQVSSTATKKTNYDFLGWYDASGNRMSNSATWTFDAVAQGAADQTYYARFKRHLYTVYFVPYLREADGTTYTPTDRGGTVDPTSKTGYNGDTITGTAVANTGYRFVGWYTSEANMKNNTSPTTTAEYTATINQKDATYYALFVDDRSLTVSKTVTGNMGDLSKHYNIDVTIKNIDNQAVETQYEYKFYQGSDEMTGRTCTVAAAVDEGGNVIGAKLSFSLANGESFVISHLPGNAEYIISEADYSGENYSTSYAEYDENGNPINDASSNSGDLTNNRKVTITNNKQVSVPPTGVKTDLSWLWMIPLIFLMILVLIYKRKTGV